MDARVELLTQVRHTHPPIVEPPPATLAPLTSEQFRDVERRYFEELRATAHTLKEAAEISGFKKPALSARLKTLEIKKF